MFLEHRLFDIARYGELDPSQNKILYSAHLARGLIGKRADETITITIEHEERRVVILRVEPIPNP